MADKVIRWITDNTHEKNLLEQRLKYPQETVSLAKHQTRRALDLR
jgi:hypothetical protein